MFSSEVNIWAELAVFKSVFFWAELVSFLKVGFQRLTVHSLLEWSYENSPN